jgi:hypothetical protein
VFMGLVLQKLGLQVNEEEQVVPSLSRLHLTSHTPTEVSDLVASWAEVFTVIDGDEYIKGENDVFRIEKPGSAWSVKELKRAVSAVSEKLPTLAAVTGNVKDVSNILQQLLPIKYWITTKSSKSSLPTTRSCPLPKKRLSTTRHSMPI